MNRPIYPLKYMRITQTPYGSNNHYKYSGGKPASYPEDDGGKDGGSDGIYAPCDLVIERVYGLGTSGVNTFWITSTEKVEMPVGTVDYLSGKFEHCPDSTLSKLKVGQKFKQKQLIGYEGKDGATANHIHMSFGRGKIVGNGWTKNNKGVYVLTTTGGTYLPQNALWVDRSFTTILNGGGMPWKFTSVTNIAEKKEEDFMAKEWRNGASSEKVYGTVADCKKRQNSIGSLDPKEIAICTGIVDGCYLVYYNAAGTKKCGFVAFNGGIA